VIVAAGHQNRSSEGKNQKLGRSNTLMITTFDAAAVNRRDERQKLNTGRPFTPDDHDFL
jgi:hypothetical protein